MNFLVDHYVVKFTNDNVNPNNFALCDADFNDAGATASPTQALADLIAYFAGQGAESMADTTRIVGVTYYPAGTNFGLATTFPTVAYAAIKAIYSSLPTMTAYGVNIGRSGESLAPLGTSIVMTEYTAIGGPGGRGRHFVPFISENLINAQGTVATTAQTNMDANYRRFLMDTPTALPGGSVLPGVVNAAQSHYTAITLPKTQPIFSNLRSRRR